MGCQTNGRSSVFCRGRRLWQRHGREPWDSDQPQDSFSGGPPCRERELHLPPRAQHPNPRSLATAGARPSFGALRFPEPAETFLELCCRWASGRPRYITDAGEGPGCRPRCERGITGTLQEDHHAARVPLLRQWGGALPERRGGASAAVFVFSDRFLLQRLDGKPLDAVQGVTAIPANDV